MCDAHETDGIIMFHAHVTSRLVKMGPRQHSQRGGSPHPAPREMLAYARTTHHMPFDVHTLCTSARAPSSSRLIVGQLLYQCLLVGLHALQRLVLQVEPLELGLLLVDHRLEFQLHTRTRTHTPPRQ